MNSNVVIVRVSIPGKEYEGKVYTLDEIDKFGYCFHDRCIGIKGFENILPYTKKLTVKSAPRKGYMDFTEDKFNVFCAERVGFWINDDYVKNYFHAYLKNVDIGKFYILNKAIIDEFNNYIGYNIIPSEDPTETSALFYHETY